MIIASGFAIDPAIFSGGELNVPGWVRPTDDQVTVTSLCEKADIPGQFISEVIPTVKPAEICACLPLTRLHLFNLDDDRTLAYGAAA